MKRIVKKLVYPGLIFIICNSVILSAEENLYVFYPSTYRPQIIQDKLQNEMKGIRVTVFGRYVDFISKVQSDSPDAVITKTRLIEKQLLNYSVIKNGVRSGTKKESFILLSIDSSINTGSINQKSTIGVIDFFGRSETGNFVADLLSGKPKIKRVNKIEDLLPLLSFNLVCCILIEKTNLDYFQNTSTIKFSITPLKFSDEGIIALAQKKGISIQKINNFTKQSRDLIKSFFHVDKFE
ncbi:MAG: hypothetical protein GXY77_04495 [Fibrobacter sp.]|nr:hypothetical protein [Fibrobacter sp.]